MVNVCGFVAAVILADALFLFDDSMSRIHEVKTMQAALEVEAKAGKDKVSSVVVKIAVEPRRVSQRRHASTTSRCSPVQLASFGLLSLTLMALRSFPAV
jgi:hypothetical protein